MEEFYGQGTVATMAARGAAKLRAKAEIMKRSWDAAKPTMIKNFEALPFGPTIKANFREMVGKAVYRSDPEKWSRNWQAKIVR